MNMLLSTVEKKIMKLKAVNFSVMSILSKIILLLTVFFTLISCQGVQEDFSGMTGKQAPDFMLFSSEGERVHLLDYKNKVVVLFFLGSGCPTCKAETPSLEGLLVNPYLERKDYVFLGLDYWNGDPATVKAYKEETGVDIPILMDAGNVGSNFKTSYNRIVVIDKDNNVVFSGTQEASKDMGLVKVIVDYLLEN
jgi:peroxiredoxin